LWRKWLPLFDVFRNPSEGLRIDILTLGSLIQGAELALVS